MHGWHAHLVREAEGVELVGSCDVDVGVGHIGDEGPHANQHSKGNCGMDGGDEVDKDVDGSGGGDG